MISFQLARKFFYQLMSIEVEIKQKYATPGLFYVWQCFNLFMFLNILPFSQLLFCVCQCFNLNLITFLNILSFSQESAFVSNYFSTICDPIFRATPPRRGLFVINLKEFLRKLS